MFNQDPMIYQRLAALERRIRDLNRISTFEVSPPLHKDETGWSGTTLNLDITDDVEQHVIVTSSAPQNGFYSGLLLDRDNYTHTWKARQTTPIWILDKADSVSMTPNTYWNALYAGVEGGGPYWMAAKDVVGRSLDTQEFWVKLISDPTAISAWTAGPLYALGALAVYTGMTWLQTNRAGSVDIPGSNSDWAQVGPINLGDFDGTVLYKAGSYVLEKRRLYTIRSTADYAGLGSDRTKACLTKCDASEICVTFPSDWVTDGACDTTVGSGSGRGANCPICDLADTMCLTLTNISGCACIDGMQATLTYVAPLPGHAGDYWTGSAIDPCNGALIGFTFRCITPLVGDPWYDMSIINKDSETGIGTVIGDGVKLTVVDCATGHLRGFFGDTPFAPTFCYTAVQLNQPDSVVQIDIYNDACAPGSGSGTGGSGSGASGVCDITSIAKGSANATGAPVNITLSNVTIKAGRTLIVNVGALFPYTLNPLASIQGTHGATKLSYATGLILNDKFAGQILWYTPSTDVTGDIVVFGTSAGGDRATDIVINAIEVAGLPSGISFGSIENANEFSDDSPTSGMGGGAYAARKTCMYLQGAIITLGPVSDSDGIWQDAWNDGGQDDGTASIRLCEGYRIIDTVGDYNAAKTGITARPWIALLAGFQ